MVPKSDHLANPRFDKKPSAQRRAWSRELWKKIIHLIHILWIVRRLATRTEVIEPTVTRQGRLAVWKYSEFIQKLL